MSLLPAPEDCLDALRADYAVRAAHEGIPVAAIGRILKAEYGEVQATLKFKLMAGVIVEMPKLDWPPTARMSDRLPTIPRTATDDDLQFTCRKSFKMTPLEAVFLVYLLRNERGDKDKLHNLVEAMRFKRASQPDSNETTDPKIVDVMICKLRKKLKLLGWDGAIHTVWGGGYYLEPSLKPAILQRLESGGSDGPQDSA
jgi:Transcriptional regulatory protein, C terminal